MIDSSKLVTQQLRQVEIKRELARRNEPTALSTQEMRCGPCVLLSREYGSAGDEVAEAVGRCLHWQVFNREITEEIAQRAHVRNQLVESVDEQIRSRWHRLLHPIRERENLKPETYLYYLHDVVLALGQHGYAVIVGRGAQYLLPIDCAIRVRVVEPLESRVRRISATRQLTIDEATRFVRKHEAERTEFIRRVFHQDANSALDYDLVLNTGLMIVEAAALAVLSALEKKLHVKMEAVPCAMSLKG